jgi:hypothetical protein
MSEDSRDRLYELLPAVYRQRDAEGGLPLRSVLRVMEEQVEIVERDIGGLYENWFIETCEDWVVPYVADLVGYLPVHEAGEPVDTEAARERNRILIPRREVANTVRNRRRKGTLYLLELLARDVAGWPSRAVEFYTLLAFSQALNHQRPERGRTVDLRHRSALGRLDGPFDELAHMVDVRRIGSPLSRGRYNLPNVGLFVWRHRAYPVTEAPANVREDIGSHCYTFSVLGNDTQLYAHPVPEAKPAEIAGEKNLPLPIRRRMLEQRVEELYGAGKSLYIRVEDSQRLVRPEQIVAADLGDWSNTPPPAPGKVAVDPELGRIVFRPDEAPSGRVRVSYHYGFPAAIGGGEYRRNVLWPTVQPLLGPHDLKEESALVSGLRDGTSLSRYLLERFGEETRRDLQAHDPSGPPPERLIGRVLAELNRLMQGEELYAAADELSDGQGGKAQRIQRLAEQRPRGWDLARVNRMIVEWAYPDALAESLALYRVGEGAEHRSINAALERWREEKPRAAVVEILDSADYVEPLNVSLGTDQTLHFRAANRARPVIRLLNYRTDEPDPMRISGERGSRFALDGLLIAENAVRVEGELDELILRHSTLVPGWGLRSNCEPRQPARPSLELRDAPHLRVAVQSSILGSIQVIQNEAQSDPIRISLEDSILDATSRDRGALDSPGHPDPELAHVRFLVERSTVFGDVRVHSIDLAENSIFEGIVRVARRQVGCLRFCSLMTAKDSRTPRRYNCQPDLAEEERAGTGQRVRPRFNSTRYGTPGYCQLSGAIADEIARGADDESEMGVFHDLFGPQREANLRARLEEYTPAGKEAAVFFVT